MASTSVHPEAMVFTAGHFGKITGHDVRLRRCKGPCLATSTRVVTCRSTQVKEKQHATFEAAEVVEQENCCFQNALGHFEVEATSCTGNTDGDSGVGGLFTCSALCLPFLCVLFFSAVLFLSWHHRQHETRVFVVPFMCAFTVILESSLVAGRFSSVLVPWSWCYR